MVIFRKIYILRLVALIMVSAGLNTVVALAISPQVIDSVVSVLPKWPDRHTHDGGMRPESPEGTAVAVLPGGYLATNVHVIKNAEKVTIRLEDGRVFPVEVVGRDQPTDIALLKAPIELPVPETGVAPEIGGRVCAIGNQFGLGLSVSCGVVSAVARTGTGFNPIEDFIQTDAAVNPGGSGGALIDGNSRLVGLVSAIFTKETDANIGVNFASSMRLVRRVVTDLRDHGRVLRGNPGLTTGKLSTEQLRRGSGAVIIQIERNSGAFKTGLQAGDIITAVGDRMIKKPADFTAEVHMYRPDDTVEITFTRAGNQSKISFQLAP